MLRKENSNQRSIERAAGEAPGSTDYVEKSLTGTMSWALQKCISFIEEFKELTIFLLLCAIHGAHQKYGTR